jgi:hypothetical protein
VSATAIREAPVSKKKQGDPKRYGTLIRVSDEFAESIRRASSFEGVSVAEFAALHLLPIVERRYKEAVLKEARRVEGQG